MKSIILITTILILLGNESVSSEKYFFQNNNSIFATIAGKKGGDVLRSELATARELTLMNDVDSSHRIVSFHITFYCPKIDPHEYNSNSKLFPASLLTAFKFYNKQRIYKIYIDNIRCVNKNRGTLELEDMAINPVADK